MNRPDDLLRRCPGLILLLTLAFWPSGTPGQSIQHFTPEDGLVGSVVRDIDRDATGTMWFACWSRGVSSYDGLNWSSFGTEDGLPNLDVRAVRVDARGRVWAGTVEGIACRVGARWETVSTGLPGEELPSVFSITTLEDGAVWFGLRGEHVILFEPNDSEDTPDTLPEGSWTKLSLPDSNPEEATRRIIRRSNGQLVIGGDNGIRRYVRGTWFDDPADKSLESIEDLAESNNGVLYASGSSGLWRRGPNETDWSNLGGGVTRAIGILPSGRLALGRQGGVDIRSGDVSIPLVLVSNDTPLPMQTLRVFPEVNEVWVGTKLGVFRVGNHGWNRFHVTPEGYRFHPGVIYADENTPATTIDSRGTLLQYAGNDWQERGRVEPGGYFKIAKGTANSIWLLRTDQAIRWDLGRMTVTERLETPPGYEGLLETRGGRLFSYSPYRFYEYIDGQWIEAPPSPRGEVERVTSVLETSSGQLVVSTLTTLSQWELVGEGEMNLIHRFESTQNFRGLAERNDGSILVGANEEGVYEYDDGELTFVMPYSNAPSARGAVLFLASDGKLWTGALELGIAAYNEGRWVWYGVPQGIPGGGVRTIVESPDGAIWASVDGVGIVRYIPSPDPPETEILQMANQIPHGERSVFQFVGRDFWKITPDEELVYSWRIARLHDDNTSVAWTIFSGDTSIISPHLGPGEYVFEVRAADTDFNLDPTPATAVFTVLPPYWATAGFIVPLAVLLAVCTFVAFLLFLNYVRLQTSERHLRSAMLRAESANRAKSQFLAHVSHEIRTPMNAILGHVQVMQAADERTAEDEENLATIARSGDHLLELINNVLEMARIEAGRTTVNLSTFDLHATAGQIVKMLEIQCDPARTTLSLEFEDEVPGIVVTDQSKLRQILINILGNAIKFTESGSITVHFGGSPVPDAPRQFLLDLKITDTGQGIESQSLERVFAPFEQAAAGGHMGGAGLGLAISRRHLDALGGTIDIDSTIDVGTVVRITLPVETGNEENLAAEQGPLKPIASPDNSPGKRVLIVDDIDTNLQVLKKLLQKFGFDTKGVSTGEKAIEAFQNWRPDVILMDKAMPRMDGIEATRRIRALEGGADAIIIFVTAGALDDDRYEIMACGATDIIRKPFRHAELLGKIEEYLGKKGGGTP